MDADAGQSNSNTSSLTWLVVAMALTFIVVGTVAVMVARRRVRTPARSPSMVQNFPSQRGPHTGGSPAEDGQNDGLSWAEVLGTQPIAISQQPQSKVLWLEKEPAPSLSFMARSEGGEAIHMVRLETAETAESSNVEWDGAPDFANFSEGDGSVSDRTLWDRDLNSETSV